MVRTLWLNKMKKKYIIPQSEAIAASSQAILAASQEGITIGDGNGRPAAVPIINTLFLDNLDDNRDAIFSEEQNSLEY